MPDTPHIIASREALAAFAAHLTPQAAIGLDTEFLRERTYRAELCLVQIASAERAACIDPLALPSLAELAAVTGARSTVKVLHAARQDLEVLVPVLGMVAPVFDTQVAAALAGFPAQIGYAELVRRQLGVELDKAHTRTDWSRRPLAPEQIEYALDDVRHLLPLRERLVAEIASRGRSAWLEEELQELADARSLCVDPDDAWRRVKGLHGLGPERRALARTLAAWRERRASARNRPRGWILEDALLREIVLRAPRTPAQLVAIAGLPPAFARNCGEEVLALIGSLGLPEALPPPPRRERPDAALLARMKRLASIVQGAAQELGLSAEILATRRELEQLAEGGASDSALLRGWRGEVLAERLRAAL